MALVPKQNIFSTLVAKLILHAQSIGLTVTLGEAWRPQVTADYYASKKKGIKNSLHTLRLAIDINLFKNGDQIVSKEGYRELGIWWEAQSTKEIICCWGGRFNDAPHFSISHEGVK